MQIFIVTTKHLSRNSFHLTWNSMFWIFRGIFVYLVYFAFLNFSQIREHLNLIIDELKNHSGVNLEHSGLVTCFNFSK